MQTDRRKSIRVYASSAPVARRLLPNMSRVLVLLVILFSVCFIEYVSTQPITHATNAPAKTAATDDTTQTSTTTNSAATPASAPDASPLPSSSSSTPSSPTGSSSSPDATPAASSAPTDPLAADIAAALKRQADDTREMKYVIGLLRNMPTVPSTPGEGARTLVMTSKNGSKFKCTIPHPSAASNLLAPPAEEVPAAVGGVKAGTTVTGGPADANAKSAAGKSAGSSSSATNSADPYGAAAAASTSSSSSKSSSTPAASAAVVPEDIITPPAAPVDPETARKNQLAFERKHIPLQVKKILGDGCFTRQIDFWAYEVCPFKRIRQYHRKPDTQTISMEFGLGSHTALADAVEHFQEGSRPSAHALHASTPTTTQTQAQYQKLLAEINSSGFPEVSYTQVFEGGTNNRQSSVTFRCNLDPNPLPNTMHLLIGVREPKPHHYEFEIRTKLLCRDADGRLPALDAFLPGGGKTGAAATAAAAASQNAASTSSQSSAAGSLNAKNPTAQQQAALNSGPVETGRLKSGPHRAGAQKDVIPNVLDLLEPMGQECMYLNTGWWTYKFCYLKEISQFHREQVQVSLASASVKATPQTAAGGTTGAGGATAGAAGAAGTTGTVKTGAKSAAEAAANLAAAGVTIQTKLVTTAEFVLGQLQADLSVEHLEKQAQIVKGDSWETTYVSQHYYDGTVCDLNNRPRISETRIYCDLHESTSVLKSVVESATCEYIIIVHTPTICPHPLFKPDVPKIVEITCEPLNVNTNQPAAAVKLN